MADVNVENHGSLFLFQLNNEGAQKWVDENVYAPDRLGLGEGMLIVEARYAADIAEAMVREGFEVK